MWGLPCDLSRVPRQALSLCLSSVGTCALPALLSPTQTKKHNHPPPLRIWGLGDCACRSPWGRSFARITSEAHIPPLHPESDLHPRELPSPSCLPLPRGSVHATRLSTSPLREPLCGGDASAAPKLCPGRGCFRTEQRLSHQRTATLLSKEYRHNYISYHTLSALILQ